MAKAFRIGHPLDRRQNRLEILDEDGDISCAIEDIEIDKKDDPPLILLEDDDDGDGIALSQRDLEELWPYLEAFRKNGSIGTPKVDLDRANHISSSQQDGSPYIHVRFGSTRYDILVDDAPESFTCPDVVAKAIEHTDKLEAHENSDSKEKLLTLTMQIGIASIQSSKAEKWKQIAEAVRTPTTPPESTPGESYY